MACANIQKPYNAQLHYPLGKIKSTGNSTVSSRIAKVRKV